MSNMICFQDVSLVYESKKSTVKITDNLNISLRVNDFTCILGPSGCGKTTLLNVIAGFQFPSSGKIIIGSASRNKFNPNISYVFQGHNIFPWKTVKQNIAFGLGSSRIDDSLADRIDELASKMGLAEYLDSYPDTLSGGLKQRVGVARALISSPDVLLMDEPFASIDELTAHSLRTLLKDLYKEKPMTIVFVTHNIDEALELGSRILVISKKPMQILLDERIEVASFMDTSSNLKLKSQIYKSLQFDSDEK